MGDAGEKQKKLGQHQECRGECRGHQVVEKGYTQKKKQIAPILNKTIDVISSGNGVVAPARVYNSATSIKKPGFCTS